MEPTFNYGPLPVIIFAAVLMTTLLTYKIVIYKLNSRRERQHES